MTVTFVFMQQNMIDDRYCCQTATVKTACIDFTILFIAYFLLLQDAFYLQTATKYLCVHMSVLSAIFCIYANLQIYASGFFVKFCIRKKMW